MSRPAARSALVALASGVGIGLLALAAALWLGHPWTHAALIGLGAGCVALALVSWWASRTAGEA